MKTLIPLIDQSGTMSPEDLEKFWESINQSKSELIMEHGKKEGILVINLPMTKIASFSEIIGLD